LRHSGFDETVKIFDYDGTIDQYEILSELDNSFRFIKLDGVGSIKWNNVLDSNGETDTLSTIEMDRIRIQLEEEQIEMNETDKQIQDETIDTEIHDQSLSTNIPDIFTPDDIPNETVEHNIPIEPENELQRKMREMEERIRNNASKIDTLYHTEETQKFYNCKPRIKFYQSSAKKIFYGTIEKLKGKHAKIKIRFPKEHKNEIIEVTKESLKSILRHDNGMARI